MDSTVDINQLVDLQAEAGVIASFIFNPKLLLYFDSLKPKYFADESNQCLFWAIQELGKKGVENIDAVNLSNMINSNGAIKRRLSNYNLNDLNTYIEKSKYAARCTEEEVRLLVDNVTGLCFRRRLIENCSKIQSCCMSDNVSLSKLNTIVDDNVNNLLDEFLAVSDSDKFGKKIDDIWETVIGKRRANGTYGIPSKFPSLGNYFTYEQGELVVIAGRKKQGKSVWMMNEAIHKLQNGVGVVYFDSEMSDELFMLRMISNLTGISVGRIKAGAYSSEDEVRIDSTREWIKAQNFFHIYLPSPNMEEVYATVKLLKIRYEIGFVIYDYIKANEGDAAILSSLLGRMTDCLKNRIAGELGIPVLAGAQLSRSNDIADSDKISRYASTTLIWRQKTDEEVNRDGNDCGNYCLRIKDNRNGEQMDDEEYIDFVFDGSKMMIQEAKRKHIDYPSEFAEED